MPKVTQEYIDNKKRMIVESCMRVCKRKPVEMVTMTDVIEETGLSQGGIYRFYKDLDEILRDMILEMRVRYNIMDDTDKIIEDSSNDDPATTIRKMCAMLGAALEKNLMDLQKLNFDLTVLAINEPDRVDKILGGIKTESNMAHLMKMTRDSFVRAQKEGKISPDKDIDRILNFMSAAGNGILLNCIIESCYKQGMPGIKSDPKELYATLADSMIALMGVKDNEEK